MISWFHSTWMLCPSAMAGGHKCRNVCKMLFTSAAGIAFTTYTTTTVSHSLYCCSTSVKRLWHKDLFPYHMFKALLLPWHHFCHHDGRMVLFSISVYFHLLIKNQMRPVALSMWNQRQNAFYSGLISRYYDCFSHKNSNLLHSLPLAKCWSFSESGPVYLS